MTWGQDLRVLYDGILVVLPPGVTESRGAKVLRVMQEAGKIALAGVG